MTELLQSAGVGGDAVASLNAKITTPSKLHRVLRESLQANSASTGVTPAVGTVPFKQGAISKRATELRWFSPGVGVRCGGYESVGAHPPQSAFVIE